MNLKNLMMIFLISQSSWNYDLKIPDGINFAELY